MNLDVVRKKGNDSSVTYEESENFIIASTTEERLLYVAVFKKDLYSVDMLKNRTSFITFVRY